MDEYYNNDLISEHNDKWSKKSNYHWCYKSDNYNVEFFLKNKDDTIFQYTYDINNPDIKDYMSENQLKFKTMCLVNIYLSNKNLRGKKFKVFVKDEFVNLFKEYSSKYIEYKVLLKKEDTMIKLLTFDKTYNNIFKTCKDKNQRIKKHQFKKEYEKYLECGNIELCNLKDKLYMFVAYVSLLEEKQLA